MILSPSILACDFARLGEQVGAASAAGCEWLHLDVMDGVFVPNISIGFPVVESLRKVSGLFFDVHLMICEPMRYVERFAKAGADLITLHAEALESTAAMLEAARFIRSLGKQAGLSIRPATDLAVLEPVLDELDLVLVMTVEPGYGGQGLIEETLPKISRLRDLRSARSYRIEVDGGVKRDNIGRVVALGADVIVAGTAVFGGDIEKNVRDLRLAAQSPG